MLFNPFFFQVEEMDLARRVRFSSFLTWRNARIWKCRKDLIGIVCGRTGLKHFAGRYEYRFDWTSYKVNFINVHDKWGSITIKIGRKTIWGWISWSFPRRGSFCRLLWNWIERFRGNDCETSNRPVFFSFLFLFLKMRLGC